MHVSDLTKEVLLDLYQTQKLSPETIGGMVQRSGRTVRYIMEAAGVPRHGPSHLRSGRSATWNVGLKRSVASKEKNRLAHLGRIPHNKGMGSVQFQCEVCGKQVTDKPYRRKRTCSKACKDQLSVIYRGEKHWNYSERESVAFQKQRYWSEYREWRSGVLEQGDYACRKCLKRGGKLTAHHLNNWAEYPEQKFDVSNGAALCWPCHWSFHRSFGHKHTTKDMFSQWLTMN